MGYFTGKTIIITGAGFAALKDGSAGSIGFGIATAFAKEGANLAITGRNVKKLEAAKERLEGEFGIRVLPIQADVNAQADNQAVVKAAVDQVMAEFGRIDALVNNAGIAQQKLLTDITDEDWRRMLDVNLSGAFYVTRAVLPGMISLKSGSIVNVSSVWGQVGASCEVHYSAAKAGLIGLTRALAKEVGPSGVTVNCVCPGVIQTDMLGDFTGSDLAALAEETPLGRLGTPQEVAAAILWLCQGDAAFVTGQVIGVGGGFGA